MKRFENKILIIVLTFALTTLVSTSVARAHAKLLGSKPADGATLSQAPKIIELEFNQALQAAEMSEIAVTDSGGKRVDKQNVVVFEGKNLRCDLEELISGVYTVEWKTLSADNHSIKGKFSFRLALPQQQQQPAVNTAQTANVSTPQIQSDDKIAAARQTSPMQESGVNPTQSFVRWLMYLAMMSLFGGFAFLLLALKPSLRNAPNYGEETAFSALRRGTNRFVQLTRWSLGLLFISALASLAMQTFSVFGASAAPSHFLQVLTQTSYGFPWLLQIASILALFAVVFFIARQNFDSEISKTNAQTPLLWLGFVVSSLLFLTPSLTGHARAAANENQFAVYSNWLHLAAAGIWVGGLFHLILTLPQTVAGFEGAQRWRATSGAIGRFSSLAIFATALLALTGVYNSLIYVDSFAALTSSFYGIVLLAKASLFLPMLLLGGYNTFVLRPRAERRMQNETSGDFLKTNRDFYRAVKIEAALGAVVLLLAAVLAHLPPPREQHHTLINGNARGAN
jgi:copper transport protein